MSELNGKALVLSGRFSRPKTKLKEALQKVGAKFRTEVSKNTDYLVEGSNPKDHHLIWAERHGTTRIDEDTFLGWLQDAPEVEIVEAPKEPELRSKDLEAVWLTPEDLEGKEVAVCGRFKKHNKEQVLFVLEEFGTVRTAKISKDTDYVFTAGKATKMLKEALELGITVVNEAGFLRLQEAYDAQEAETEVPLPKELEAFSLHLFHYQECCITGEFDFCTAAELRTLLKRCGVRVRRECHKQTRVIFSGRNWGESLRQVVGQHGSVWTEGQLLLYRDGLPGYEFPHQEHVPNGANLSALDALEEGVTPVLLPEEVEGELMLHWKRVHFPIHLRFAEIYGHIYRGMDTPYVGQLYYEGEPLQPDTEAFYGAESFQVDTFWEDGNDLDRKELRYDGTNGFNCSALFLPPEEHIELKGKDGYYALFRAWEERSCYGDVSVLCENVDLGVNLEKKTFKFTHHMGPYRVSPHNPWI